MQSTSLTREGIPECLDLSLMKTFGLQVSFCLKLEKNQGPSVDLPHFHTTLNELPTFVYSKRFLEYSTPGTDGSGVCRLSCPTPGKETSLLVPGPYSKNSAEFEKSPNCPGT
jgi:hypothetical protein